MDWKKTVAITCSYNEEAKKAKDFITVDVVFDFTTLTEDEILEWLVNGQSPRVYVQGILRKLTRREFNALNKTTYTVVIKPTGTRGARGISREQALRTILGTGYDAALAKFGDVDKLYDAFQALMTEPAVKTTQDAADEIGEMDAPEDVEE